MSVAVVIVLVALIAFLAVAFRGAPYVPTHRRWVQRALEHVPKKGLLVDLGSGDGVVLKAAAERGQRGLGIELNPLLVVIARWRLRRYRGLAAVQWGDFWRRPLPDETTAIFVFAAGPYIAKLVRHVSAESQRLGHGLTVVSYGFELPGLREVQRDGPLFVYRTN